MTQIQKHKKWQGSSRKKAIFSETFFALVLTIPREMPKSKGQKS